MKGYAKERGGCRKIVRGKSEGSGEVGMGYVRLDGRFLWGWGWCRIGRLKNMLGEN